MVMRCFRHVVALRALPIAVSSASTVGASAAAPAPRSEICATRRFTQGGSAGVSGDAGVGAAAEDPEAALMSELQSLTLGPIQIGHLFKSLSKESRAVLARKQLPLETFLLRHKANFKIFKPINGVEIYVCAPHAAPINAVEGRAAKVGELFDERGGAEGETAADRHRIYTVLRFIPNEWSPFSNLGIPEEVLKVCIGKKPKLFFEKYPKYFEVKNQNLRAHTFEVRRSLALQQHMEKQAKQRAAQQHH